MVSRKKDTNMVKSIFRKEESTVKTAEERIESLHERMEERRQKRERRKTGLIGTCSAFMAVFLVLSILGGATHNGGTAGMFSGSTMLFDSAGGYVLVAVIAFMLGATIVVLLIRQKNKKARIEANENETDNKSKEGNQT